MGVMHNAATETATRTQLTAAISYWTARRGKGTDVQQALTERTLATLDGRLTSLIRDQRARVAKVYSDRDTDMHRIVHTAVTAVLDGCSNPVVILGVDNLVALYEGRCDLPDIERGERYLAECWTEHTS